MDLFYLIKVVFILSTPYYTCSTTAEWIVEGFKYTGDGTKLITKQLLLMNESIGIYYDILIPEGSTPPLMMMSVMLVKELDCDIEPSAIHIYPSFLENKPVLDLNAANESQDAILTPLTSAFIIDISTKTLKAVPSAFMVHLQLYNSSGIKLGDNEMDLIVNSTSVNGSTEYSVNSMVSVNSTDMEGVYKFYFHSSETVQAHFYIFSSKTTLSQKVYFVQVVFYIILVFAVILLMLFYTLQFIHLNHVITLGLFPPFILHMLDGVEYIGPLIFYYCQDLTQQLLTFSTLIAFGFGMLFLLENVFPQRNTDVGIVYLISFGVLALYTNSYATCRRLIWSCENETPSFRWILKYILCHITICSIMVFVMWKSFDTTMDIFAQMKAMIFIFLLYYSREHLVFIEITKACMEHLQKEPEPSKELLLVIEEMQTIGEDIFKLYTPFFRLCMLYALMMPSNVFLAAGMWLGLPNHLFWLQIAMEELFQLYIVVSLGKVVLASTIFMVKFIYWPADIITYSKKNIVFFLLCGKCCGLKKWTNSDKDQDDISKEELDNDIIENVKKRSALERIELALWFLLRNPSLLMLIMISMFYIFAVVNIRQIIFAYNN